MSLFRCLVIFAVLAAVFGKPLNPKKVIYAIDCGNSQGYTSNQGITYKPDRGFSDNTKTADYSTNSEAAAATIKYTYDPQLYMTERHADDTFHYDVPVSNPGTYVLISRMSENWLRQPKQRVFNIMLGSCMGDKNIDIFERAGGRFAAYDSYIEFELKNNNIYKDGQVCRNAFFDNKLRVQYTKIGQDNPKVDAIMLFEGPLSETDHGDLPKTRQDWDKRQKDELKRREEEQIRKEEARLKRREKLKVRNDEALDFGDDYESDEFNYVAHKSIGDYISDYLGLLVVLGLAGVVIYFLSSKADPGSAFTTDFGSSTDSKEKKDKGAKKAKKAKN